MKLKENKMTDEEWETTLKSMNEGVKKGKYD